MNIKLIAISPQTPDQSLTTSEKNKLSYQVVSDSTQEVIKKYNLLFEMSVRMSIICTGRNREKCSCI
ncbi:redoxin domain-containing protein [Halobacillus salinus]|uniref:Redoxin domain-containing protein n=1 Tax=Halobacillus salinus TaxID=192814 RepID=A0A4Z0H2G6_9BACI|nr:redoxin domain-containing protein [Halobacillus salinus]